MARSNRSHRPRIGPMTPASSSSARISDKGTLPMPMPTGRDPLSCHHVLHISRKSS